MAKTLIKSAILAGAAVFVWGFISWMVLPWHMNTLEAFKDESAVSSAILENTDKHGVYYLPNSYDANHTSEQAKAAMDSDFEKKKAGPTIFLMVRPGSKDINMAVCMFTGFVLQVIIAALITFILLQLPDMKFGCRVKMTVLISFIAGLMTHVPGLIWWEFPAMYTFINMVDLMIGWVFGGLVISKIVTNHFAK